MPHTIAGVRVAINAAFAGFTFSYDTSTTLTFLAGGNLAVPNDAPHLHPLPHACCDNPLTRYMRAARAHGADTLCITLRGYGTTHPTREPCEACDA
jgi:methyl coenzyme M reductase subunit C-like uncharacterized protein (methanogenesis marker protein 7)